MWQLLKGTVIAFINDEALSRGAAIAFYTVTSIAPLLLIVIAVAGLVFGEDAAQGAITAQLGGLMGQMPLKGPSLHSLGASWDNRPPRYCKARSQMPPQSHRVSLLQLLAS